MGKFGTLLIFAALGFQIQSVRSVAKCKKPKGTLGTHIWVDCNKLTCVKSGKKPIWKDCPKPATEDSIIQVLSLLEDIVEDIVKLKEECFPPPQPSILQSSTSSPPTPPPDDYDLLFLGPSAPYLQGFSEVLNLPELTPAACSPPPYPLPNVTVYVGTLWKEGILICGGYDWYDGNSFATCYWLKRFNSDYGYWFSFPPLNIDRALAATAMLGNDWWVTGGYSSDGGTQDSTELLSPDDTWGPGVDLPEPTYGHCLVTISSTQVFMCGGQTISGTTGATYIYTLGGIFAVQSNMPIPRYYSGCALYNDAIWVAGGTGATTTTVGVATTTVEFFSLIFSNWNTGPSLTVPSSGGRLLFNGGKLVLIGGTADTNIYQLEQTSWVPVGTVNHTMKHFSALKWKNCTNN